MIYFCEDKILYHNWRLNAVAFRPAAVGAGGTLFIAQAGAADGTIADVNILVADIDSADMGFQDLGDGVGDRLDQLAVGENRLRAAYALQLIDHFLGGDAAAQGQRYQAADGFGVSHGRVAAFANGGEDFERFLVKIGDCDIEVAQPGGDLVGGGGNGVGAA